MTWWIIATVVYLVGIAFGLALAKSAGDADRRLAEMRGNDDYTRGG